MVGEGVQCAAAFAVGTCQAVVVDERVEAVAASVPDVPYEGAVVEESTVLLEEAVAEPVVNGGRGLALINGGQQGTLRGGGPLGAVSRGKQFAQTILGGEFASDRWDADDAVAVGEVG